MVTKTLITLVINGNYPGFFISSYWLLSKTQPFDLGHLVGCSEHIKSTHPWIWFPKYKVAPSYGTPFFNRVILYNRTYPFIVTFTQKSLLSILVISSLPMYQLKWHRHPGLPFFPILLPWLLLLYFFFKMHVQTQLTPNHLDCIVVWSLNHENIFNLHSPIPTYIYIYKTIVHGIYSKCV